MSNNILITSISSKVALIHKIIEARDKFDKSALIFGSDINNNVLGKIFVDKFWLMKKIANIDINDIILYCKNNNIKYIFPTRDEDVYILSKSKNIFLKHDIHIFSPEFASVEYCYDKFNFYINRKGFNIIPTYNDINQAAFKSFVIKERYGSGSKQILLNTNKNKAVEFSKKLQNPIFQPFIKGIEFSVDSYLTKELKAISIARTRDLVENGEAVITTYVKDEKLEKLVKEFVIQNNIFAHSVTQVIKDDKGNYHIIECNTRFGGASTLSYTMGLESFYWFLLESINKQIKFKQNYTKLKQVRIQKDIYFES